MFKTFLLELVAGAIVPLFLFSFLKRPLAGTLFTVTADDASGSLVAYVLNVGRALVQAYVWMGWAVYCGLLARSYGALEEVAYPGVYFVTAFLFLNGPLAALSAWGCAQADTSDERSSVRSHTWLLRFVTTVGFVIFCVSPGFLESPYGWLVGGLNIAALGQ